MEGGWLALVLIEVFCLGVKPELIDVMTTIQGSHPREWQGHYVWSGPPLSHTHSVEQVNCHSSTWAACLMASTHTHTCCGAGQYLGCMSHGIKSEEVVFPDLELVPEVLQSRLQTHPPAGQ